MHCKDVSVRKVDFELDSSHISLMMKDYVAYKRTEYLVLENGADRAVVAVNKKDGDGLFSPLESFEILSLPKNTVYVEIPDFDVINQPAMAALQAEHPGKTVVIKGMFSHINVISGIVPIWLRVVDNTPPSPSKLGVLVRRALASGFVEHPIIPEFIDVEMADKVSEVCTEAVMFPCEVSNLRSDKPFYFLDKAPKLKHEVTLIGCHLSERIYKEVYGKEPILINVCPMDHIPDDGVPTITKCCKVKNGTHKRDGNMVAVPWGATVPEVVDAINDLFSDQ